MLLGAYEVFSVTMTSGATLTGEVDLKRAWSKIMIDTTGAASEVRFQGTTVTGGTYRQVLVPNALSSTVESNIWKVSSAASGSLPYAPTGLRYMKIETTATVANGVTFKLICSQT